MVTPIGTDAIVRSAVGDVRIAAGDWLDRIALAPGVSATLTPANHCSARGLGDRRMALWSGFWIESPGAQIWFAGDTVMAMARSSAISARYGAPGIALIPIGAYEPRRFMSSQHVAPEEAVKISAQRRVGYAEPSFVGPLYSGEHA